MLILKNEISYLKDMIKLEKDINARKYNLRLLEYVEWLENILKMGNWSIQVKPPKKKLKLSLNLKKYIDIKKKG